MDEILHFLLYPIVLCKCMRVIRILYNMQCVNVSDMLVFDKNFYAMG